MANKNKMFILAVNCGSSTLKFGLFALKSLQPFLTGSVQTNAASETHFVVQDSKGKFWANHPLTQAGLPAAIQELTGWLHDHRSLFQIEVIVHRIVQGGPDHRDPEVISGHLLKELESIAYIAPNHIPGTVESIKAFQKTFPNAIGVACFDTYFHKGLPDEAKYYPLPAIYCQKGLIRYGFHGLSCEFILDQLSRKHPKIVRQKLIIAHLGNGASLTAVVKGKSVDTTMGLSPLGGLVMGTRCGDLDSGVMLYLLRKEKLSVDQLEELLSKQSGLQAIAGKSDMESLIQCASSDPKAEEAIRLFCYNVKKSIGALAAAMGGLDMLVFTGGIGEHASLVRARCCSRLKFMGVKFSNKRNSNGRKVISKPNSQVKVLVMATNEAAMMAKHAQILTGNL